MKTSLVFPSLLIHVLALWLSGLAAAEAAGRVQSFDFARIDSPIAGVAAGERVVFVGQPLDGKVIALSRDTGAKIGELPPPPGGFAVPFIMHAIGEGKVAVLDAGGLPLPATFTPAHPAIYEYTYTDRAVGFSAALTRTVSFDTALIGFSEDFIRLEDGRYLLSDAILGSVWVAEPDGSVIPGIVPQDFGNPATFIPTLALCPTMPLITVNGYPFLFTGSTLPGISPMAVRDGRVYFYSPCARGIYAFPIAVLEDERQPHERAADIRLVAPTPADVAVEELLDFTFNSYDPSDSYLYAANPLSLQVIRINVATGAREVLAGGGARFDFPSALAFLPPRGRRTDDRATELLVVSNQQERSPLTNDAVTATTFNLPFIVARIRMAP